VTEKGRKWVGGGWDRGEGRVEGEGEEVEKRGGKSGGGRRRKRRGGWGRERRVNGGTRIRVWKWFWGRSEKGGKGRIVVNVGGQVSKGLWNGRGR